VIRILFGALSLVAAAGAANTWSVPTFESYVILRGVELRNAGIHGVLIRKGVQHVVNEDSHITGWEPDRWHARLGREHRVGQRYYSPGWGRFMAADPYLASRGATNPSSWNGYAYVAGDPVNNIGS
jgi:RHS repeat-associated protein